MATKIYFNIKFEVNCFDFHAQLDIVLIRLFRTMSFPELLDCLSQFLLAIHLKNFNFEVVNFPISCLLKIIDFFAVH